MNPRHPSETRQPLFDTVAGMAGTLGSPARLKILHVLAQAPRSVDAVAAITGETVANVSQHLQKLRREGLVDCRKEKLSRIYRVADPTVALLLESLFDLAERVSPAFADMDSVLAGEDRPVALRTVIDDIRRRKAALLDIREAYEASHSPVDGAIRLPLDDLPRKARTLAKTRTYYVVCRGRACALAARGVKTLRAMGFRAYRLKDSPAALRAQALSLVA
jgi:DNA-binding transcriptional ArsR family regulator/rhodanese-related sulfurtransferase